MHPACRSGILPAIATAIARKLGNGSRDRFDLMLEGISKAKIFRQRFGHELSGMFVAGGSNRERGWDTGGVF
jgi:hypothetical protein